MWWIPLACSPDPAPAPGPSASPTSTSATTSSPAASDAVTVAECDPAVHVPGLWGAVDAAVLPDPHADVFGAAPEPFHVHYSFPGSDPSISASFVWRTDLDTLATVLEYGAGGALDQQVQGESVDYGGTPGGPGLYRAHEVKLCGRLLPATTYSYRVGGEGHWSPTYTFTTPGAPGTFDTFRIAFVGDSRGTFETWADVLAAIAEQDPDLLLVSGDMIDFGTTQDEWDGWFEAAGDLFTRVPALVAHGNHEFLAPHYFAQFSLPHNELWYTVRYGNLQLVVLNDTVVDVDELAQQGRYGEDVFTASDARWKVAMHHRAAYSRSTNHGSATDLQAAWVPGWERGGVDLVVAGHNHVYERSLPIRGGAVADDGITYLVTGGAGADLYLGFTDEWFGAVADPVYHYVIGDFGPDGADFVARDLAGNVIDRFSLH